MGYNKTGEHQICRGIILSYKRPNIHTGMITGSSFACVQVVIPQEVRKCHGSSYGCHE